MAIARWEPPNQPSLSFNERVAFAGLSSFLGGHEWQRIPTFPSFEEGRTEFGNTNAGDRFLSTGDNEPDYFGNTIPTFFMNTGHDGWAAWDLEECYFNPTLTGLTLGNGFQKATFIRQGRLCRIVYIVSMGTTSSMVNLTNIELPTDLNSGSKLPSGYDLRARWVNVGWAPQDTNDKGLCEMVLITPGRGFTGEVRMETTTTFRPVYYAVTGTTLGPAGIGAGAPAAWTIGDTLACQFWYTLDL